MQSKAAAIEGTISSGSALEAIDPRKMLLPLALAQFIASYACTNMNVAVTAIAQDLGTNVHGVQTAITLFTLTMAALMIPGSKLSDIWGRRLCFRLGLLIYGIGALLATIATGLGMMIVGYSLLEGIGSALMIPPIYILVTVYAPNMTARAKGLAVISAAAGVGAATGPLVGGLITSTLSWRASFLLQVLAVAGIIILSRRIRDVPAEGPRPTFDFLGAVLNALALFLIVFGVLLSADFGWFVASKAVSIGGVTLIQQGGISPVWLSLAAGLIVFAIYFWHASRLEHAGKQPLLGLHLFRNRTSNLGLVTQCIQWLIMQGSFFVISVFLQTIGKRNAVQTGLILSPATVGILLASALAGRMARNRTQRFLIRGGFVIWIAGLAFLLVFARSASGITTFVPGLLINGLGIGIMLTASANVVQSAFPDKDQGEISGLSRSVSNLGSSFGTAIVGSVLVGATSNQTYGYALLVMGAFALIGLGAAMLLPPMAKPQEASQVAKREMA
ncbi:MAG TPA: MFS transporter [Candidatus Dormibacteraeota bacterium]|nr:MFS transporter [Candidatus Dormibacteraeota bacterium]